MIIPNRQYFSLLSFVFFIAIYCGGSLHAEVAADLSAPQISDPAFIIVEGGSIGTDSIKINTSLLINKSRLDGSHRANYRVVGSLRSFNDDNLISLENANNELNKYSVVSDVQQVNMGAVQNSFTKTISLNLKPVIPLSTQNRYRAEFRLQKSNRVGWSNVGKLRTGDYARVYHFTSTESGDPDWNLRGSLEGASWKRTYALQTDTERDHFEVTAESVMLRFDDWDLPVASVEAKGIFRFEIRERDTGKLIELQGPGSIEKSILISSYKVAAGIKLPTIKNVSVSHKIYPRGQLDSTKEYILECEFSYTYDNLNSVSDAGQLTVAPQRLLHFNGNLYWGGEPQNDGILTTLNKVKDSPQIGPVQDKYIKVIIRIPDGKGSIKNNYVFGDESQITVRLDKSGNAIVDLGNQLVSSFDGGPLKWADPSHCLGYSFGAVHLSQDGIYSDSINVELPQGHIYIEDYEASKFRGQSFINYQGTVGLTIKDGLIDLGDAGVLVSLSPNARIVDESHPLVFGVTKVQVRSNGELLYSTSDNSTDYIHKEAFEFLDSAKSNNDINQVDDEGRDLGVRASNDLYLRGANASGNIVISAASDCSSRLTATIDLQAQQFLTHFPSQMDVNWQGASAISLKNGVIQANSRLTNVSRVLGTYHQGCPESLCSEGVPGKVVKMIPSESMMAVIPGGGIMTDGVTPTPEKLKWGGRGDGMGAISPNYPYAHRTDENEVMSFYSPGYQLYALDNDLLDSPLYIGQYADTAPSVLLLSGVSGDPLDHKLYLPVQDEYLHGNGLYAGFNYVLQDGQPNNGASRLGGSLDDYSYQLMPEGASKYYTRLAGVFGRHVAIKESLPADLKIYGYDFGLNSFQLTFIASKNEDSWVNGNIVVSGHSNFKQNFKELSFDCVGELENALIDPDDVSEKALVYWNSTFIPRSIRFEKAPLVPGNCPETYKGILTMGASTKVANVPTQLHGVLGFEADDGNLLTQLSGDEFGVNSELRLPGSIAMEGPDEDYSIVPVGKLRFSNPDGDPHSAIGQPGGFVSYAATIDVPYFKDLQIHVITSATEGNAPVFLASGWEDNGEDFFNNIQFDPDHVSWPGPGNGIDIEEYKSPNEQTSGDYVIHANQDLFGLIGLSYPLSWDYSARSFSSMNPLTDDLFVLNVEHQVDFLDSSATKLSFGAKFEGIPKINISNLLNSQIDGAAQAVSDVISYPLKDGLDNAFEEFEKHLADSLDDVIDPIVDQIAEDVLDPLYVALKESYNDARSAQSDWNEFLTSMDHQLKARIYVANGDFTELKEELCKFAIDDGDLGALTSQLNDALMRIINGIDVIINKVEMVESPDVPGGFSLQFNPDPEQIIGPITEGLVAGVKQGILSSDGGSREILSKLVVSLLSELVEPEIAALIEPLLDPVNFEFEDPELSDQLNSILDQIDPSLERITETLSQLRGYLIVIYEEINALNGLAGQFNALVAEAKSSIQGFSMIMSNASNRAREFIISAAAENGITEGADEIISSMDIFDDFDKEEFISSIKTQLKDSIIESPLIEQYQFLLRQQLYDIQSGFEQAVSSVLSNVSNIMKDLISETAGFIDEEINGMLGSLNEYMGTAEVSGYAHFNGDSLRKVRLDNKMQIKVPDEMLLNTYLEILAYTSMDAENGCVGSSERLVEVTVGADDVPFDWISDGLNASLDVKISLKDDLPNGVGGGLELTGGTVDFQIFEIDSFAATFAAGGDECYLGGRASARFDSYEVSAGIFFGRTCTVAPLLLVDQQVGDVFAVSEPFSPMTGAYVYGEVWLPISELVLGIPATCFFNISAGVGTGVGFFIDGNDSPVFVGKMFAGISGEALCAVSIRGEVEMTGIIQDGSFSALGSGTLSGKAGVCPFCIKFSETATLTYSNGDWDIDY
jgi:hypothetical protein